jgi:hypothetical protein
VSEYLIKGQTLFRSGPPPPPLRANIALTNELDCIYPMEKTHRAPVKQCCGIPTNRSPSKVKVDISPSYDAEYFPSAPVFLIKFLARQCQYSTGPTAGRPHIYHSQIHNDDAQAPPHSRTERRGINKNTPREIPYLCALVAAPKLFILLRQQERVWSGEIRWLSTQNFSFLAQPAIINRWPANTHACVRGESFFGPCRLLSWRKYFYCIRVEMDDK